jgi:hypothetical protein
MTDVHAKWAVLAALRCEPEFSSLVALPNLDRRQSRDFLQWLDRSGLALIFWERLQQRNATSRLTEEWRRALRGRLARNIERTKDILEEAQRINSAFGSFGVVAATIKGFTLSPDFCGDPYVRHQVDFDFLTTPLSVPAAAEALRCCGYSTDHLNESGETCFLTPLKHIPSIHDDVYVDLGALPLAARRSPTGLLGTGSTAKYRRRKVPGLDAGRQVSLAGSSRLSALVPFLGSSLVDS